MSLSWELLTFGRVQVEKIKSYRGWVNPVCLFIQVIPQVFDNLSCERFCVLSWEALVWRVAVHSLSRIQLLATPWTLARQAPLSFTISRRLLKFMSIELVMPSNHLVLCRPLLLLPSILLSIRVVSNEPVLHIRWPKYWSFSFSISPSNEYSGLISFRIDWFDLLAIQGTLKSRL